MTKIDIFSGFLGAGKTTLIKKLIQEAYAGEQVVLIENEFGEIGIDGGFLQEAGVNITEMNSGCICCSLVGDFAEALKKVAQQYHPDRIIIEPSGVGKLSDVIKAVQSAEVEGGVLNAFCTVVDAKKCKMYVKNFGEFFLDQVQNASSIILSHTDAVSEEKLAQTVALLKEHNPTATFVTAVWSQLDGKDILSAMEQKDTLQAELERLEKDAHHHHHHDHVEECGCGHHHHDHDEECCHEHHHHDHDEECSCEHHHHDHDEECGCGHHHHDHDEECGCGHHHHDHDEECCHEHHHHDHDEECGCGHHHHDHDEECGCGHHHHDHGHHHHADEVFTSFGVETTKTFTKQQLEKVLQALTDEEKYGVILRAKGIVAGESSWLHFDYVPEEVDVREGKAGVTGRLCVIGCNLNEDALKKLFDL